MTNPPGEDQGPERHDPEQPQHPGSPQPPGWGQQPGSWQQQGYPPPGPPPPGYPPSGNPPPGYPQYPQYPQQGPVQYAPDHPKATTSLVLGLLSVVLCQVLGPVAWVIGKRTVSEIDASQGRYGGRGSAQAGYILGVVGSVLLGLVVLYLVFMIVLIIVAGTASM